MNKTLRTVAASFGAAALIGASAAGASAHEGHHRGFHHSFSHHGFGGGYGFGQYNMNWFHQYSGPAHSQLTFAQKQTLIVDRLNEAAAHLQTQVDTLTIQNTNDPSTWTAQALANAQAKQTKLQALITAVKAATDDASLKAAFQSAFAPTGTTTPTAPTAPSTSTTPGA